MSPENNRSFKVRDDSLRNLLDKQEIYELLVRYCRAIDRCDEQLLRSVYHPDATDLHGVFDGTASDFCSWVIPALRKLKKTTHRISNVIIEVDGEIAFSEAYFVAFHRFAKEGKDYDVLVGGRYLDRFERRNGIWKIAHRQVVFDWNRKDLSTEEWGSGFMIGDFLLGQRAPDDPVCKMREHRSPRNSDAS
jgi:ketosteroid isomerase-like protein